MSLKQADMKSRNKELLSDYLKNQRGTTTNKEYDLFAKKNKRIYKNRHFNNIKWWFSIVYRMTFKWTTLSDEEKESLIYEWFKFKNRNLHCIVSKKND